MIAISFRLSDILGLSSWVCGDTHTAAATQSQHFDLFTSDGVQRQFTTIPFLSLLTASKIFLQSQLEYAHSDSFSLSFLSWEKSNTCTLSACKQKLGRAKHDLLFKRNPLFLCFHTFPGEKVSASFASLLVRHIAGRGFDGSTLFLLLFLFPLFFLYP